MNADRKAQVIAKYARITRENHQLRIENQHLRERHLELEDQLLASRNRKWKERAVSLEAELYAVRCELRDAKASIALSDKLLRGARDRRDLWEHRYWTLRKDISPHYSLPGGVPSLAPAGSPAPRSEDLPSSAGSDPVPAVSVGNETPVRIRASRASGTPAASPGRHAGGERQDITSNGDRRKASSRASAAVARREV